MGKAEKAAAFRKKAAELREAAKSLSPSGRDELLFLAGQYDELAVRIERDQPGQ
jgi:hypothetical protein